MYTALYRSFRPETFDGILGQEHIVKNIEKSNQDKNNGTCLPVLRNQRHRKNFHSTNSGKRNELSG